jgi:hypothetical protein
MVGTTLVGTAAAAAAAAVALAGHVVGVSPTAGTVSPFGGSQPVRIAHVGRIDVDLEHSSSAGLRRVPCAGGETASTCFVAP